LSAVRNDNDIGLYVNSAKAVTDDRKSTFSQARMYFHLDMIFKRMRMERVLSWGIFCGIERAKLFMNVHFSATWKR